MISFLTVSDGCGNKPLQTVACSNRNLFSNGSGGQKSKINLMGLKSKRQQDWFFLGSPGRIHFLPPPAAGGCQCSFIGTWMHHPTSFPLAMLPSPFLQSNLPLPPSSRTPVVTCKAQRIICPSHDASLNHVHHVK